MNEEEVNQQLPELSALTKQLSPDAMVLWSEDKRKEFVSKFNDRTRVSQYISLKTAEKIKQKAEDKQFVSKKHTNQFQGLSNKCMEVQVKLAVPNDSRNYYYQSYSSQTVG